MGDNALEAVAPPRADEATTRSYQQEMLEASLVENIIIAQDTGSGKTHIAVLRMKIEFDREPHKVSWFLAPTVALCEQQHDVINKAIGSVGLIHGGLEPKQWTDPNLWKEVLIKNRVIVSTPQVLLDALSHGYINLGREVGLLIFDEAHHANDDHPMNCIMKNFYFSLPVRQSNRTTSHGPVREERPMILGLTASPMFGGNAAVAFRTLETNLDSVIRSPRRNRDELEAHVHRPVFKHVLYDSPPPYSTCHLASQNLQALKRVVDSMDIEQDPFVLSLRSQLETMPPGQDRTRVDQKLSKTIQKQTSYTHKGLRDLLNTSHDICFDLGPWAADWYIQRVVEKALENASPYSELTTAWQAMEKTYLIDHLKRINVTPVSHDSSSIENGISAKLRVLIQTLEEEKERAESFNEPYSGLVFVTRRDAVLALAAVLEHHPRTSNPESFRVGCLLGSSESTYRTAFLDITRKILREPQGKTLDDFRSGEKNLIVATAVAEEGLDIQACGNVVRWDVPNNMASWTQSRGRARRKRSSFVLMFESGGVDDARIEQFESLEREMVALYNADRQVVSIPPPLLDVDDVVELREFKVESTGALLTLQAAVSHLNHFCSVLPSTRHGGHLALYDIDPPDLPEGWHSLDAQQQRNAPYQGPYGCTLTLPKALPPELRVYQVERKYPSKRLAYQHVAFNAYLALYEAGLLNDHLLPLTSVVDPELEEDVRDMLKDIEKRAGTASVTSQLNPWLPSSDKEVWWSAEVEVEGLPPLTLFTQVEIPALGQNELPVLYHPHKGRLGVKIAPGRVASLSPEEVKLAQRTTRRLLWSLYGSRMKWQHLDFAYFFTINNDPDNDKWESRRSWSMNNEDDVDTGRAHSVNTEAFTSDHGYPIDITWVRDGRWFGKLYRFVGWQHEKLSEEEEAAIRAFLAYSRLENVQVTYPLLIVEPLHNRVNFLLPLPVSNAISKRLFLLPKYSYFELLSPTECEHSLFIPSILHHLTVAMTVSSLRSTIFPRAPLAGIPSPYLTTAVTAPVAEDTTNYQRLETLGDTVLKFVVATNLLAAYPLWHEGYLTRRKDHAVANSRLAKEAIRRSLFQWIIRTRFSPKRFKPLYFSQPGEPVIVDKHTDANNDDPVVGGGKTRKAIEELSTKMLADVVESLIGAAYLHGGFDLGISCAQFFGLGLEWNTLPKCVELALSRVQLTDEVSTQLTNVECMLGYTFKRKLLLVESLTHASYQYDDRTVSYERMEFLGDALLDMVVTDLLYHYPGKEYSPHDMHIRKSAVVNTHFLAYICLRRSLEVDASMPGPGPRGGIIMTPKTTQIHLFQCLQHSSPVILEDQRLTFSRFEKIKDEIEESLKTGKMFPWAALTRMQAPKVFSDMIESLIGAVYLDSESNMDIVRELLRSLGILTCLERFVRDEVDVLHPVSRLSVWASRQQVKIEYNYKDEKGRVVCTISVEGREPVSAGAEKRGHASQEEARFAAAEKAIDVWAVGQLSKL
ncbi:P-loop containing nucleoside triphosphate hydrolase protein [Paxillus ammoniavirescens]|nr:P-loop containing nucleoside triphosphate hydrolase protein [Paxillus ammoniavirescens]